MLSRMFMWTGFHNGFLKLWFLKLYAIYSIVELIDVKIITQNLNALLNDRLYLFL